jgi:hypothetical protein
MAGQKRRPNSPEDELRRKAPKDDSAASLRRGGKSVLPFKDDNVANLPRTASGGSKPTPDEDESPAPLRKGGKSVNITARVNGRFVWPWLYAYSRQEARYLES